MPVRFLEIQQLYHRVSIWWWQILSGLIMGDIIFTIPEPHTQEILRRYYQGPREQKAEVLNLMCLAGPIQRRSLTAFMETSYFPQQLQEVASLTIALQPIPVL